MNDRSETRWRASGQALLPAGLTVDVGGPRFKILEAALRLFATKGFHGASVRDIVGLVEMQASAVYAHFPSKEHVLAELARAGHEAHHEALQAAVLDAGAAPVDQLCAFVRVNAVFHATHPHMAMVVSTELHALSADLAAPALAMRRQSTMLLLQILDRGVRMGDFELTGNGAPARDPVAAALERDTTAAALGAMAIRIPNWYSAEDGRCTPAELAERHVALALRMVGARRRVGS
jgi:AcrR family transcriptional regulator